MNRKTLGQAAFVSLTLGIATIACTPDGGTSHVASASDAGATAKLVDRTRAALDAKNGRAAVRLAEKLVAQHPASANYRMLLGQAYLADGRFASAQAAFADTLGLAPGEARAAFNLALAEIAVGKGDAARTRIAGLRGAMSDSNLGLALALAGDHDAAIARLTDAVRAGQSDARTRQNLALAYALAGRWDEARGMAMQDTPPDRIEAQIAGWRALAKAGPGATQVAAMLGVTPTVGDPGLPAQLALAQPTQPSVNVALADATPLATPALVAPVPVPVPAPTPVAPPAPVAVAEAAPVPTVPTLLAPVASTPPRFVRVALASPAPVPARAIAPGRFVAPRAGGFVVQLGAYARAGAVEAAWAQASRLSPHIATFSPVTGRTRWHEAALVRLSLTGFETRAAAAATCAQIKARGADCFVRAADGDAPLQWVRREPKTQLAMR